MIPVACPVVRRKLRPIILLSLGLSAVSTSAQINEADRLARCENNRNAIAALRNQIVLAGDMSDGDLARARSVLVALRKLDQKYAAERPGTVAGDNFSAEMQAARKDQILLQMRELGRVANIFCIAAPDTAEAKGCALGVRRAVEHAIDTALRARTTTEPLLRQLHNYETNYAALGCLPNLPIGENVAQGDSPLQTPSRQFDPGDVAVTSATPGMFEPAGGEPPSKYRPPPMVVRTPRLVPPAYTPPPPVVRTPRLVLPTPAMSSSAPSAVAAPVDGSVGGSAGGRIKFKAMTQGAAQQMAAAVTGGRTGPPTTEQVSVSGQWLAFHGAASEIVNVVDRGGEITVYRGADPVATGVHRGGTVEILGSASGEAWPRVGRPGANGQTIDWGGGVVWQRR